MKNVFISFNLKNDIEFVSKVYFFLKRQPFLRVFMYERNNHGSRFNQAIGEALNTASYFVFFRGKEIGTYQADEALKWFDKHNNCPDCRRLIIELNDPMIWPDKLFRFPEGVDPIKIDHPILTEGDAARCAAELSRIINNIWIPYDGLPERYIFDYEKDIIEQFASPRNKPEEKYLKEGCPEKWPCLEPAQGPKHENPLK